MGLFAFNRMRREAKEREEAKNAETQKRNTKGHATKAKSQNTGKKKEEK